MGKKEREAEIRAIFDEAETADSSVSIVGNSGTAVVGNHNAIIINDRKRPGERIDDGQLQELRDRMDSLVRVDAILAGRDQKDRRSHRKRLDTARRRHWRAFRDHFRLKSYAHLTNGRFDEALCWLENRKQDLLDAAGPPKDKHPSGPSRPIRSVLRLLFLGLVVLAVPLMFSVERTRPPDPSVTGPIAAIATDEALQIKPAGAAVPAAAYRLGFHAHAGCSFFRQTRPAVPTANSNPQAI